MNGCFTKFDQFNIYLSEGEFSLSSNTPFLEVQTAWVLNPIIQPSNFQMLDKSLWLSFSSVR